MQRSWRNDGDKLTFIVCRPGGDKAATRDGGLDIESMVGDVNLFISTAEDDAGGMVLIGELELMIAEQGEQRKGYGRAALLTFLSYITRHEADLLREFHTAQPPGSIAPLSRFDHFAVKIGETNRRSMALFESMSFRKTSDSASYFGEYELRLGREGLDLQSDSRASQVLDGYAEIKYSSPVSDQDYNRQ